jgi:hypothetical protein
MPPLDPSSVAKAMAPRKPLFLLAFTAPMAKHRLQRQMRWQVGPDLTDFLRAYAKRLRNWFREAIANLRGSFQAVAAIYRVDLEPPEIETSEEHTRIAADLDQLKKWGG